MTTPKRPRGQPKIRVVLPDGDVVYGREEAARRMGYKWPGPLFEKFAEPDPDGGWRLCNPKDSRWARITLPDGDTVIGWPAASARLGRSKNTLRRHAVQTGSREWRITHPRGPGRRVAIHLPDGRTIMGWEAAAAALRVSVWRLRWHALPADDGYTIRPLGKRPRRYGDKTQRPRKK